MPAEDVERVRPRPAGDGISYVEPARRYTSSLILLGVLALGFVLDLLIGGGLDHLVGWLIAVVAIVGVDALATHAARVVRSITVTATELRLGEKTLPRKDILGYEQEVDASAPIFGRGPGEGLPRGSAGLTVRLADGTAMTIPTRRPQQLLAALRLDTAGIAIRQAGVDDLEVLIEIDERAESLFRVAGLELPRLEVTVADLQTARVLLVAGRPPVGFARVDEVDGLAHLESLAVVPGSMRQGLGSALLAAACRWAAEQGYPAITLSTYAEVAWNAPFYARRGFVPLAEMTPQLSVLRDHERAAGLDTVGPRIVMRREL